MSTMTLRTNSKSQISHVLDLNDNILKDIFAYCNSVEMARLSLVNRRFREVVEDMEEDSGHQLRCNEKARIFVCDRRRAILEGMSTHIPKRLHRLSEDAKTAAISRNSSNERFHNSYKGRRSNNRTKSTGTTESDGSTPAPPPQQPAVPAAPAPFIADMYADNKQPNWAFKFDFSQWADNYEIAEVFFKNFCSFYEREKSDMEMDFKGRTPSPSATETRKYDKLPSTQPSEHSNITHLTPKDVENLKTLSAGRVERLASTMEKVRNAHFVFRDYCCYTSRPPVLIFWFLSLVRRNVSRITFDRLQAASPCEGHEVLHLANIHRLTVHQPETRPAIIIRAKMLISWLRLADPLRKKISIHLTGCKELTPKGLAAFVVAWRSKDTPAVFKQISIDANSFKFNDFMTEMETLLRADERTPPKSPFSKPFSNENANDVVLEKMVDIYHSKCSTAMLRFRYCKPSRRMVLSYEEEAPLILKPLSPVSTFSRLAMSRNHSAAALQDCRNSAPNVRVIGPEIYKRYPTVNLPQQIAGCRENSQNEELSLVNRFLRFLATSN